MKPFDNDNDPLPFITLAAATANVIRKLGLTEKKIEERNREPDPGRTDEKKRAEQLEYVRLRVREIDAFERRAAGNGPGRKRN